MSDCMALASESGIIARPESSSISRILQHSILQLCNEHIGYTHKLQILGVLCMTVDDERQELVVKVNNTLKRVSPTITKDNTSTSQAIGQEDFYRSSKCENEGPDYGGKYSDQHMFRTTRSITSPRDAMAHIDSVGCSPALPTAPSACDSPASSIFTNYDHDSESEFDNILPIYPDDDSNDTHSSHMSKSTQEYESCLFSDKVVRSEEDSLVRLEGKCITGSQKYVQMCKDNSLTRTTQHEEQICNDTNIDTSSYIGTNVTLCVPPGKGKKMPVSRSVISSQEMEEHFGQPSRNDSLFQKDKEIYQPAKIKDIIMYDNSSPISSQKGNRIETDYMLDHLGIEGRKRRRRAPDDSLTTEEVAEYLGYSQDTLSKFKCRFCNAEVHDLARYLQHTLTVHNAYICHQCGKSFTTKSSLLRHRPIHTGMRRFACTICKKTFYRKDKCKTHIKRHLGITADITEKFENLEGAD